MTDRMMPTATATDAMSSTASTPSRSLARGGYYGAGGIQKYTLAIEDWGFDQFDGFIARLRDGTRTLTQLRTDLLEWQANIAAAMKGFYANAQWPNSYEAESWANAITGSARRVKNSNMSWGGKVIDIGPGSDLTLQKVRVDGAGTYEVKIHYTTSTNRELLRWRSARASCRSPSCDSTLA